MCSPKAWLGPMLFGALIYLSIDNFGPSDGGYNRQVAGYMVVAAAALLIFSRISGRTFDVDRSSIAITAALVVSVAISTIGATPTYVSANRLHLYYAAAVLGFALYMAQPRHGVPPIGMYFAVVSLVHIYFLIQIFFWLMSVQSEVVLPLNRMPHYANIRHFAYHGFLAAVSSTALFVMYRRCETTSLVLTAAALFGIVLLGARGALLAWLASVVLFLVFSRNRKRLFAFSSLSAGIAVGSVYHLISTGLVRAPTLIQRMEAGMDSALYAADRLAIWADAVRAIGERPWFGFGPEGYILSRCCNLTVAQPHNFVLQFLLEIGVIGSTLLFLALVSMIRSRGGPRMITARLRSDVGMLALFAFLLSFLAYSMIDGLLYHAIPVMHFAVFLPLLLVSMESSPSAATTSNLSP